MISFEDLQHRKHMWDDVEGRIHSFFKDRGFICFRTPILAKSPGMEPNLAPLETTVNKEQFGLITSPEYAMKKLLGAGFEKIYTITPVFRNNEYGSHNIPEFTMLEWYGGGEYEDLMNETEELLQSVLEDKASWKRFFHEDAKMDAFGDPHVEESRFFVRNYPVKEASLAKLSKDGTYAERFEAFADGLELCNGFAELTEGPEQQRRFEEEAKERAVQEKTVFPIDEELIQAIDKINRPVYGNALGVDRLVMLKYGVSDINDIQLFNWNQ